MNSIVVKETTRGTVWAPVISYDDKIYMYPKEVGNAVTYTETTTLGNPNNFLEYNYNEGSDMKTVIGSSQTTEKEEDSSPSNSSVQYERKKKNNKSVPEIDSAMIKVFEDLGEKKTIKIAKDVKTGKKFAEDNVDKIVNSVLKLSKAKQEKRTVINEKVRNILDRFCK
jgi:hypothetical protein